MEQYTFSPEEKETLEKLAKFQESMETSLKDSKSQINYIRYYENFEMRNINFKDVYMVEIIDEKGITTYHVYAGDNIKEIITIDKDGKTIIAPVLEEYLKDLDFGEEVKNNEKDGKTNLTGISEKVDQEKIKEEIEEKEKQDNKTKEESDKKNKEQKINKDLNKEFNQDLKISYYRKIEDDLQMQREFPSLKGNKETGIAYSKALNSYICVTNDGENFKKVEEIEPSKLTYKTVISIDEQGNQIQRKVPHALMKTNNERKEMSITIGEYGYVETGIVDRLPCDERLEYQVREAGQGEAGRSSKEIRDAMYKGGNEKKHQMAHEFNENEEQGMDSQNLEDLDNDNELQLSDGTITTFEEQADKANMSVEGFKELYEEAEGQTVEERLENAQEEANIQYGAPSRKRENPEE